MNVVILKGNLTRDPEIREVGETKVGNFTLAVNRKFSKNDGTKDQDTSFVDCEVWDSAAQTLGDYVKKGDPLLVRGSLKLDTWETDGQKRSKLKVRVMEFEMDRRVQRSDSKESQSQSAEEQSEEGVEIPF